MKAKVAVCFLLTVSVYSANAQVWIGGAGATQCGVYLSQRQNDNNQYEGLTATVYTEWANGYMSGYNNFSSQKQFTTTIPRATLIAFIDKYCRDKPLVQVATAVDCLIANHGGPNFNYCK